MFVLTIISLGVFISLYRGVDGIPELDKLFCSNSRVPGAFALRRGY